MNNLPPRTGLGISSGFLHSAIGFILMFHLLFHLDAPVHLLFIPEHSDQCIMECYFDATAVMLVFPSIKPGAKGTFVPYEPFSHRYLYDN